MISLAKNSPPAAAILLTSCVIATVAVFAIWPSLLESIFESISSGLWFSKTSENVSVNSSGLYVKTIYNPIATTCIFAMTFLVFAGTAAAVVEGWKRYTQAAFDDPAQVSKELTATGLKLDNELKAILALIRAHLEANETYSEALAHAHKNLPAAATPQQVRMIVKLLIADNEKIQRDAADLRRNLEQSRSQIEVLRANLTEAQNLGMRDALTSLGNRRCFDMNLAREVTEAQVRKSDLCLVLGDIDNFKKVNDNFGHLVGDEILKMFARLLSDNVKGRDTVARYGGEEFAIILPQTAAKDASNLTERIRSQFEAKRLAVNKSGEKLGKITASFGIAQLNEGEDADALVNRADAKLYEAKRAGRNRVAVDAGST